MSYLFLSCTEKFTLLTRGQSLYLTDRYSERKESAEELSKRVNQRSL
ncbi:MULTISPECIES: hypothetical protein [Acinetobacter]|nr:MULTISPECIES: hypothetical protein [Acinetobacter]EKL41845.1 hypothetical protein ACIN5074_3306 [Acinetobacter baumannii OIFC074]EKP51905.1 hypothetical protein ACINNAV21_3212 [Acinetobacter baumannii Naval-21]KLT77159.1 hypothetical protein T632_0585 [Acinetobacter baumannii MRSN 4106]KLT95789.1 hypothetical protein T631_0695 [Acinetobacter baumannii MRSN 3942]KLT99279.1 hypothetical protein T629_0763 [Acinetobacter baumannii MRSN 3405]